MKNNSRLSSLLHLLSPRVWLMLALVSVVLAFGSSAVLVAHQDNALGRFLLRTFDTVELFLRDTVRLTFRNRSVTGTEAAVFVAPMGILDKKAAFNWIDEAHDFKSPVNAKLPEPHAPTRLLDPAWQPPFAGLPEDKESR